MLPYRHTAAAALVILSFSAAPAGATLFTGSSGNLAAAADFSIVNSQLQVVLTNTSTSDVLVPSDVLTGVFFTIASNPAFTSISAVLGSGSSVVYGTTPSDGVVGGEWAYTNSLSGAPGGANEGISSTGLNLFGAPTFPGANLAGPDAVDGLQFGLLSAGDDTATGNTGVTGNPLVKNAVVFKLGNVPLNFNPATAISGVTFQYGTDLSEPQVTACSSTASCIPTGGGHQGEVPEPASMALLGSALVGLGAAIRRRRR